MNGTPARRTVLVAIAAGAAGTAQAATPLSLVMLGDSLTAGLGLRRAETIPSRLQTALTARGKTVRVVNAGSSGETSSDLRSRLVFSTPTGTGGAFVAIGGNDMLQGQAPSLLRGNLEAILTSLRDRRIKTALAGMRASANLGAAYRREFDAIYPALARQFRVPFYPFLLEGVALNRGLNQADGIHPNAAGAQVIADRLAPFMVTAFGL